MSIEGTRNFLLRCTVINYGVLLVWFLLFAFAHGILTTAAKRSSAFF